MGEAGSLLRHAVTSRALHNGDMSRLVRCTHVGEVRDSLDKDVLPSPVDPVTPEKERLLKASRAGTSPVEIRRDFPRTLRIASTAAWLFLVITVVNFLDRSVGASELLSAPRSRSDSTVCTECKQIQCT